MLGISNTLITSDCCKMVSKRSEHQLTYLIYGHFFYHHHLFFKETALYLSFRKDENAQLHFEGMKSFHPFFFLNHLSKVERLSEKKIYLKIGINLYAVYFHQLREKIMIPIRTVEAFEQVINLILL
jgi:hypothetical protein